MAQTYANARWLAPAAFVFDLAAQLYGMNSKPNMKDINDANVSFFSPYPFFIAGFFSVQQVFQLVWLYKLCTAKPAGNETERRNVETMTRFAPFYIVGNFAIGAWMFAWNSSNLKLANVFVIINTFAQLFYVTAVQPPMNTNDTVSILTHIVSKTFAGIGVLDLLHNTSVAYFKDEAPSMMIKVLTGVGFGAGALLSDWIFGACLVYDLVALSVGQVGSWSSLLGGYAVMTGLLVAVKNIMRPPYVTDSGEGYQVIPK